MEQTYTVDLPEIGEGVIEGEVIEWLKKEGDCVTQDEPVVIVMTDKATVELPAPYPGTIAKHHYKQGEIAIRDLPLYDIAVAEGVVLPKKNPEQPLPTAASKPATTQPHSPCSKPTGDKVLATPYVRGLAKKMGIALCTVKGTGKQGEILATDLAISNHHTSSGRAAPSISSCTPTLSLQNDTATPLTGFRRLTAEKMTESKYIIPHFSYFDSVDATRLVQLRENIKEKGKKQGIGVTFMPLFIRALSLTIQQHPLINSSIDLQTNQIITHHRINIGIAMNGPNGLVVPVLKDVQQKGFEEVIIAFDQLKKKAMEQSISSEQMKESTITISNFGALGSGGSFATPIINYPESAILGVARIQKTPVVKDDTVIVQDVLNLSWSFDHRIIDGDLASAVSHTFAKLIKNPSQLL